MQIKNLKGNLNRQIVTADFHRPAEIMVRDNNNLADGILLIGNNLLWTEL